MTVGDTIADARPILGLVRELSAALDAEGVDYCHWKSNASLAASLSGENDLDLLVRRADGETFAAVVHRLGFKAAVNPTNPLPGVVDYYGYDPGAPRLVHLHAHYQLVVGDDLTKNYRLPLEDALLTTAAREGELRVPQPELELIVLVIRLAVKHATWDAILLRRSWISPGARAEYRFLEERANPERVRQALEEFLPELDGDAFESGARAVTSESGAWRRARRSRALLAAVRPYARRGRAADVGLKVARRAVGLGMRFSGRRPRRKRLVAGGRVIAIIGADGAGKTTVVEEVRRWLGKDLDVTVLHLGKPPRSWATVAVRTLVRAAAAVRAPELDGDARRNDGRAPIRSVLRAGLAVALARDRAALAADARAVAANGGVVVCDRYPLPELDLMDAPRVDRLLERAGESRVRSRLAELERRYYGAIGRPDVLIVLRVDPEVAVARKSEEPPEFVRRRWGEIWAVDWSGPSTYVVDAGRSQAEVLREVKSIIWSEL